MAEPLTMYDMKKQLDAKPIVTLSIYYIYTGIDGWVLCTSLYGQTEMSSSENSCSSNCEFLSTQLKEYKVPVYIKLIILSSQ